MAYKSHTATSTTVTASLTDRTPEPLKLATPALFGPVTKTASPYLLYAYRKAGVGPWESEAALVKAIWDRVLTKKGKSPELRQQRYQLIDALLELHLRVRGAAWARIHGPAV